MKKKLIKLSRSLPFPQNYQMRKLAFEFDNFEYTPDKKQKSILVLIHPDCAIELPREQCQDYLRRIKSVNTGVYDKVFTNFFFSYQYNTPNWTFSSSPNFDLFLEIRKHLESISDHVHDTSMGKKSFSGPIADYLIENENLVVFIGGGYQDLCLRQSYNNFCSILNWLVEEHDHEVVIEKQLVFYRRTTWSQDNKLVETVDPWWDEVEVFDDPLTYPEESKPPNR